MKKFLLTYTYCLFLLCFSISRGPGSSAIVRYCDEGTHQEKSQEARTRSPDVPRQPRLLYNVHSGVRREWRMNIRPGDPEYPIPQFITSVSIYTLRVSLIMKCLNFLINNRTEELVLHDMGIISYPDKMSQVYLNEIHTVKTVFCFTPHYMTNPNSINYDVLCSRFIYLIYYFGCLQCKQPDERVCAPVMRIHVNGARVALPSAERIRTREVPSIPIVPLRICNLGVKDVLQEEHQKSPSLSTAHDISYVFCFSCIERKEIRTNNFIFINTIYGPFLCASMPCTLALSYPVSSDAPNCIYFQHTDLHTGSHRICAVYVVDELQQIDGAVCFRYQFIEMYYLNTHEKYFICDNNECLSFDAIYRTSFYLYQLQNRNVDNESALTPTILCARNSRTGATPVSGMETKMRTPPEVRPPYLDVTFSTPIDGSDAVYFKSYVVYLLLLRGLPTHPPGDMWLCDQQRFNESGNQAYNDTLNEMCFQYNALYEYSHRVCAGVYSVIFNITHISSAVCFKLKICCVNNFDYVGAAVYSRYKRIEMYYVSILCNENDDPIGINSEHSISVLSYRTSMFLCHSQERNVRIEITLMSTILRARDPRTGATPVCGIETIMRAPPDVRTPSLDGITPAPLDGLTSVYFESYVPYLPRIQGLFTHLQDEMWWNDQQQQCVIVLCSHVFNFNLNEFICPRRSRMYMLCLYASNCSLLGNFIHILESFNFSMDESNNASNVIKGTTGLRYFHSLVDKYHIVCDKAPYITVSSEITDPLHILLSLDDVTCWYKLLSQMPSITYLKCQIVDFKVISYNIPMYFYASTEYLSCISRWYKMDTQSSLYGIHDPAVRRLAVMHNTQPTNTNINEHLRLKTYSIRLRSRIQRAVCISVRCHTRPFCVVISDFSLNVGFEYRTFSVVVVCVCNSRSYRRNTKGYLILRCLPIVNFKFACKAHIWVDMGINHINVRFCFCLFKVNHLDITQYERVYNTMYL